MVDKRSEYGGGSALLSDTASPARLRVDLWNRIREGIERMAGSPPDGQRHEIDALFQRLEELEPLWAYPGSGRVDRLRSSISPGTGCSFAPS